MALMSGVYYSPSGELGSSEVNLLALAGLRPGCLSLTSASQSSCVPLGPRSHSVTSPQTSSALDLLIPSSHAYFQPVQ